MATTAETLGIAAEQLGDVLSEGDIDDRSRRVLAHIYRYLNRWAADWADWEDWEDRSRSTSGGTGRFGPDGLGWLILTIRTHNALTRAGIRSFTDLKAARDEGRHIRQVGEKGWREIGAAICAREQELLPQDGDI